MTPRTIDWQLFDSDWVRSPYPVRGADLPGLLRGRGARGERPVLRLFDNDDNPLSPGLLRAAEAAAEFGCQRLVVTGGSPAARAGWPALETRTADQAILTEPVPSIALVGEALALVPVEPGADSFSVLESPPVVAALRILHRLAWRCATEARHPPAGFPEQLADILEQAAGGATDRAAQRALNLSARTYTRRMADLLTELGARSRFQAGVQAARRGWV